MKRIYNFSIRSKIVADLSVLALIIFVLQSIFFDTAHLFSATNISILFISLGAWLFSARTSGLYNDFREKPFSYEWIAFMKSLILYGLLASSILFLFFQRPSLHQAPFSVALFFNIYINTTSESDDSYYSKKA